MKKITTMLFRKDLIKCGMVLLALGFYQSSFCKDSISNDNSSTTVTLEGDSLPKKNKKGSKTDPAKPEAAKPNTAAGTANSGVIITSAGDSAFANLKDDEVFVSETVVKREIVLEEDFKLWRIYVQKGRKNIEYRKVEVPFGIYCKRNEADITEEAYYQETKDLPEGETKRFKRDDYEAKEREKIMAEINSHFSIQTLPATAPADSLNGK